MRTYEASTLPFLESFLKFDCQTRYKRTELQVKKKDRNETKQTDIPFWNKEDAKLF